MLRVLVGIVVGLGYGVLVGGMMFLINLISKDPPVDLMLDYGEIFRYLTLLTMVITGSAGGLVGLIVTLLRVGKMRAALIGFGMGLLVLAAVLFKIWPQLETDFITLSWPSLSFLLLFLLVLMVIFPMGLAASGVTASAVAGKCVSTR